MLEIEVPKVDVDKAFDRAYQSLANKVNIPGFRKGKAPRKILDARLGKEGIAHEAFELLASPAYGKALDEQKLDPVSRPEIDIVTLEQGQPLVFKATVIVKPTPELGQYKGLTADKTVPAITDLQIDAKLNEMLDKQAKMVVVADAELENGDFAIIDFNGFVDEKPFSGGEGKAYPLEIGSGSFIPGFEEQLLGAKTGDTREVNVSFPAEYFVPELAGKAAKFDVVIHDIKRKELPVLDDEFAKDVSSFATVEELKADIKNKLTMTAEQQTERNYRNEIMKQAVDGMTVDLPEIMVETKIDQMLDDLAVNMQNRGLNIEDYMKYIGTDQAGLREQYRESANIAVRTDLMLDEIAKVEGLSVESADLDQEVQAMAMNYNAPVEEVRKIIIEQGRVESLKETVLRKKAMNLIFDTVVQPEVVE